ncbi:MAG: hypothetical protein KAH86_04010 [Methanosarcinales archaeon]|nr:hypothetical protein [Methanosarcinales archaeon]
MNKKMTALAVSLLMVLTVLASVVPASAYTTAGPVEIRGQVYTVADDTDITWNVTNFAGFYYDLDDAVGSETLLANITDDNKIDGSGTARDLRYTTTAQNKTFEYGPFGTYSVIGFMAEPYFAGYVNVSDQIEANTKKDTDDRKILENDDLSKILIDSDDKYTIATGDGLELKEGYVLNVQQVDLEGNKALIELVKDGKVVDTEVVYPGQETGTSDDVYVYDEADLGDKDDYPLVIARIDTVFRGTDTNVVTLEGLFQISDTITTVETSDKYGRMEVTDVSATEITMKNVDNTISLSTDSVKSVFGDVSFKTGKESEGVIRFYPMVERSEPGTYEIRGRMYELDNNETHLNERVWNRDTFAGFYYDLDDNVGSETLTANISDSNKIEGSGTERNLTYNTSTQNKTFEYAPFGTYSVIGFMAQPYFAGYVNVSDQIEANTKKDTDNRAILENDDLSKVLIDSDDKYTIATGDGLELKEGYVLNVQQVDLEGNKALIELVKDGKVVDTEVVYPGQETGESDDVYVYDEADLGDKDDYPIVIARIDTVFRGTDTNVVTLEGVFQISDTITTVETSDKYGRMEVTDVSATEIIMKNVDNTISLSTDSVKSVFGDISFRTGKDNTANISFYPMVEVTIEGGEAVEVEEPEVEEGEGEGEGEGEVMEDETAPVTPEVEEDEEEEVEPEKEPGFEAVFAITGLLAVAFLVLRQRE